MQCHCLANAITIKYKHSQIPVVLLENNKFLCQNDCNDRVDAKLKIDEIHY